MPCFSTTKKTSTWRRFQPGAAVPAPPRAPGADIEAEIEVGFGGVELSPSLNDPGCVKTIQNHIFWGIIIH